MAKSIVFATDQVERLRGNIKLLGEDTNLLRQQLNGQAVSWSSVPLGGEVQRALQLAQQLTGDAEKLEEVIRGAVSGVQQLEQTNKAAANRLGQPLSGLSGMFGLLPGAPPWRYTIPLPARRASTNLIQQLTGLPIQDELNQDPVVQKLQRTVNEPGVFLTPDKLKAQLTLSAIFAARNQIAKSQTAFGVYQAFGNTSQMERVKRLEEEARSKLQAFGVNPVYYSEGKDLRRFFRKPALEACEYDPSMTDESVPLPQMEQYRALLRLAMEPGEKGNMARDELKRRQAEGLDKMALEAAGLPEWWNEPAKKDIFDKMIDRVTEWVTGEKPEPKTQGQQYMESQFFSMQMEQQMTLLDLTTELEATMRGAASADRINEVMEIGAVSPIGVKSKPKTMQSMAGEVDFDSHWQAKQPMFGEDWEAYFKSKYGDDAVSWGSRMPGDRGRLVEIQRLQEALRTRILGYNHEQSKFSYNETLGISRAEKALNKKFQPSDTLGVDMKDPGGLGDISLKGPFLNSKRQPLTIEQQEAVIKNLTKHISNNTAVDVHIIDTLGLEAKVINDLKEALKNSKIRIIYLE